MNEAKPGGAGDRVIAAGDSAVSIAAAAGHLPETIWNDPANAELKSARGDGEVLLPGDRITVMAPRPKDVACTTGKRHVFKRKGVPVTLTLVLEDEEGAPFAAKKYELAVDGATQSGTSDDAGTIECAVGAASTHGTLKVWLEEPGLPEVWEHEIRIGELEPKNSVRGIQQRLANLGYYGAAPSGTLDEATAAALAAFIADEQLEVRDSLDDAVLDKLAEIHRV